jgi:excisionase family DNA binding protein
MGRLLSITEAAETLGVPEATLYRWRYRNTGPRSIKVGRHVKYRPEDIEAFLECAPSRGGE